MPLSASSPMHESMRRWKMHLLAQSRANVGMPKPPPPHVSLPSDDPVVLAEATTTDWNQHKTHHTSGLSDCVGPHIVARVSDVLDWMDQCPDGEDLGNQPHVGRKPPRLALRRHTPPPFVMISYTQKWCKTKWSKT